MAVEITRPGKNTLILDSPLMPAAGTIGFGDAYRDLVNLDLMGALVTNPVTFEPRSPAKGTRVVALDAGILVHTGLPNPGLSKVLNKYRTMWEGLSMPLILHLVATTVEQVRKAASRLDAEPSITAIELGLNDDIPWQDAEDFTRAAVDRTEKPVIVRLPLQDAYSIAEAVAHAGASALVVAAPPRGTARDPQSGKLVGGRVYGPLVKPMALRVVGQLMKRVDIPIIGAGGIHNASDARDYLEAGARAVQVDSVTWIQPFALEAIARDLGGMITTQQATATDEGEGDSTY